MFQPHFSKLFCETEDKKFYLLNKITWFSRKLGHILFYALKSESQFARLIPWKIVTVFCVSITTSNELHIFRSRMKVKYQHIMPFKFKVEGQVNVTFVQVVFSLIFSHYTFSHFLPFHLIFYFLICVVEQKEVYHYTQEKKVS